MLLSCGSAPQPVRSPFILTGRIAMHMGLIMVLLAMLGACTSARPSPTPAADPPSAPTAAARRELVVSLYPYVPNATALYWQLEVGFEHEHREIDLHIHVNPHYYEHDPHHAGIVSESADVYELDSVFLADVLARHKIQPLPADVLPAAHTLVAPAQQAAFIQGVWWGWPHWVCANFLFYKRHDPQLAAIHTLQELEQVIGSSPRPHEALLIDLTGPSTLGE